MHLSSSSTAHTLAFTLALALLAVVRVLGDIDHRPSSGGFVTLQPTGSCTEPHSSSEISGYDVRVEGLEPGDATRRGVEHHTMALQPLASTESASPTCIAGGSHLPGRVP